MKVRIKRYLSKEERTGKPTALYRVIRLEEGQAQGQMQELETIGEGYLTEEQATEAAILYKNNILNAEDKDIEV